MRRQCVRKLLIKAGKSTMNKVYHDEMKRAEFWNNPDNEFYGFDNFEDTMKELRDDYNIDSKNGGQAFKVIMKLNKEEKFKSKRVISE